MSTADISGVLTGLDMAPQTTRKTKVVMQSIFQYVVEQGFIKSNPVKGAYCKRDVELDADSVSGNYLSIQQAQKVMALTEEFSKFNTMIQLLLMTGIMSCPRSPFTACGIHRHPKHGPRRFMYFRDIITYSKMLKALISPARDNRFNQRALETRCFQRSFQRVKKVYRQTKLHKKLQ